MKGKITDQGKYLQNIHLVKDLQLTYIKESQNSINNKKEINITSASGQDLNKHFNEEKICLTSNTRKGDTQYHYATMKYHYTLIRSAKTKIK